MVDSADWPIIGMTVEETAEALRVDVKTVRRLKGRFNTCPKGWGGLACGTRSCQRMVTAGNSTSRIGRLTNKTAPERCSEHRPGA